MIDHTLRSRGIGGSEIGAVAGLNPWRSPHDVWETKVGLAPRDEIPTEALEWGSHMEPAILNLWRHRRLRRGQPTKVSYMGRHQRTRQSETHPLCIATPDGLVNTDGVAEVKTYGWRLEHHWGPPGTDEVPDYYLAQTQWELKATDRSVAYVIAQHERTIDEYLVPFSEELFSALYEVAERFWRDYVEAKRPPPADHTDRCQKFLQRYYPRPIEPRVMVPRTEEGDELHQRLIDAETVETEAKRKVALAKNKLMEVIGDAYGLATIHGKVLWYGVNGRQTHDTKSVISLARELGATDEQLEATKRTGAPFRVLRSYAK